VSQGVLASEPDAADPAHEALIHFLYQAPIGLAEASLDGEIQLINPMAAQLLLPLAPTPELGDLYVVLGSLAPDLRALVADFPGESGAVLESRRIPLAAPIRSDGTPGVLSLGLWKLGPDRLMAVVNDVSLEVQREEEGLSRHLYDASRTDTLTRMPNRVVAVDRIDASMVRVDPEGSGEMAVLHMNCDRFRQLSESWGRVAGDEVLAMMADRLRSALRSHDRVDRIGSQESVAARVGGDEFVVVLNGLKRGEDVHLVARRLLELLSTPYGIGSRQLVCTISMGVVLQAQALGDAETVLRDAAIAMAEAKRQGGSRYVIFQPEMAERASRRGEVENGLRVALETGQLTVFYQPLVHLDPVEDGKGGADGVIRCAGVEALVRWNHPTQGMIPPLEFIPVAEEAGLIGRIGSLVLETACRDFGRWKADLGPRAPAHLSVNLSRAELAAPDFTARVGEILQRTGMAPRELQFEVTESLAAQDDAIRSRLLELKGLGVTLALDDFGTGYSSLSSLHQLPVDTVKIDRSFVSRADTNLHHRVLIEATVLVARSLGMGTVAEGIETCEQAGVVRELGCERGQGYLFSRPLSAAQATEWLRGVAGAAAPTPPSVPAAS
jgi:diguanylate cyclase (GGDEF)-like protein